MNVKNRNVLQKKHILITASTFPRFGNDSEPRFVLDLSQELTKYFDVTVLTPADPSAELEEYLGDVRVVRYRYAPLRRWEKLAYPGAIVPRLKSNPLYWLLVPLLFLGLFRASIRELKNNRYDAMHVHWLLPQGIVQALLSYFEISPPFIVTSHGGDIHTFGKGFFLCIFQWVLRRSSGLTVVSHQIRERMADKLEIYPESIAVIPMGADFEAFSPEHRDQQWLKTNCLSRPVFLFVGRIAEKKGLKYLLEAFARESIRESRASLAIVGDGPLRKELECYAKRLDLTRKVTFLGSATHEELKVIYASAEVLCVPSIVAADGDAEGLPTVLSEAAASGLPSIGTKTGGIPEIIKHNETGLLVEQKDPEALAEACRRYIDNPDLLKTHGAAARQQTADFSWKRIGARFEEVIRRTIDTDQNRGKFL